MKTRILILCVVALAVCAAPWAEEPASTAAPVLPEPQIYYMGSWTAEHADISPPLRDIKPFLGGPPRPEGDDAAPLTPCGPIDGYDPVAQTSTLGASGDEPSAMPAPGVTFNAFNNILGYQPPDPVGDVGPNHYIVMANSTIAVYSKTGTLLWGPSNINSIWSGFGGKCQTDNAGDPVVLYDQFADRWLVSQFTAPGSAPFYNCVALSTTGDPTGTWQRYAILNDPNGFPDYPKYGVWRDGYYFSTRNTDFGTQGVYALNRDQMLAGSLSPTVVSFVLGASPSYYGGDGLLPADIDGSTLPPAGTPEFFFGSMDNGGPYSAPSDAINVFEFSVNWTTPANSTFARTATVPVAAFDSTFTPCGGGRTCIPQPGTTNKLDILSYRQRLTFRAAYRNFGTHESVALTHSVSGYNSGTANAIAGMRWYELRDPNGTPTIYQQGTYVPGATDSIHRWMGSVAMDRVGNMALGFSASAAAGTYPSSYATGRLAGDPLGTMPQGEISLGTGSGSQTSGNRWGDYTSLNLDPTDDCTFWYVNEYYTSNGTNWIMRVGSFTFPSCLCAVTPAAPAATGADASADNQITVYWDDAPAASITQYYLFRSTTSGGPYTQIATIPDASPGAGGSGTYTYDNTGVSGGTRYYYVVKANDGVSCTSANSNQVDALATGPCMLAPSFGGLATVTSSGTASCALQLSWAAGSSNCGAGLTYSVYRSTSSGFTPSDATNRIAYGLTTTAYTDNALSSGTPYYYVVRALDTATAVDDGNATERAGTPYGPTSTSNYTATDVPKAISDNTSVDSTLTVADVGTLTDVNITIGNITHTWDADLDIFLVHPDGTQVELTTDNGSSGDNYVNTVFDDSAATSITAGTAPFTGTYRPEGSLATLNGKPSNGTWILRVADDAGGDTGSLTAWSLSLTTGGACTAAAPGEVAPGDLQSTAQAWSADKGTHSWPAHGQATGYIVYRGTPAQLPALLTSGTDSCTRYTGASTSFSATAVPSSGSFYWYLVVGTNVAGGGTAGNATAGARTVNTTGNCP